MAKKNKYEINSTAGFVFKCIWFAVAVIFYIAGMTMFIGKERFGTWMGWGLMSAIPVLWEVIKRVIDSAKQGAREGARNYTVTVSSDSVKVSNHPYGHAFLEILSALFVSIFIGPVYLGIEMIVTLIYILGYIPVLVNKKKQNNGNNN